MKNKFWIFIFAFLLIYINSIGSLSAQISSQANRNNWIELNSYNGSVTQVAFQYSISLSGLQINYPNWGLGVRLNSLIVNGEGKTIDPSKISIRLNKITGGKAPSINQIGANQIPVPLNSSLEGSIIFSNSKFPLQTGDHHDNNRRYTFDFDIIIQGGSYLEALKSNDKYTISLIFFVLSDNNTLILTESPANAEIKIHPNGQPPSGPTYGIEINSNARNGLLNLKSVTDYVNGVEQVYENGLTITSKTDYQVQVRSLSSNFESGNGMTLPISTVSLQIQDSKNSGVGGTIVLSEGLQTVFSASNPGNNKKPRDFNLRYFTKPQDERLINAKPASYQTTLMFTLLPQ